MYKLEITIDGKKEKLAKEKLLTIGIITKNECEKLERCLKSLMPLKDAFDCEIIVTDTGSTDNTVEMAKKYADKVLHFEWCNDFAAARNTGIKAAKGLWFMWIDSDEWLEDTEEIIKFFKSNEYKKYASASISFIDYRDENKDNYRKMMLLRLTVLSRDMFFKGSVHEAMPTIYPLKNMKTNLYHDGYIFEDEQKKQEKHERNRQMLMEKYEAEPNNITTIKYIVQQYSFENEYEKSLEFCKKGVEATIPIDNDIKRSYNLEFRIIWASNLLNLGKYEEVLSVLEEIEELSKSDEYRRLDIHFMRFVAHLRLKNEKEALDLAKLYLEHYIIQDSFEKTNQTAFLLMANQKNLVEEVLPKGLEGMILSGCDDDYVFCALKKVLENLYFKRDSDFIKAYIKYILLCIFEFKRYDNIVKVYDDINNGYIKLEKNEFEKIIKDYQKQVKYRGTDLDVIKNIAFLEDESDFIKLNKYLYFEIQQDYVAAKVLVEELLNSFDNETDIDIRSELYFAAIKYNLDFEIISRSLDVFNEYNFKNNFIFEHEDIAKHIMEYSKNNQEIALSDIRQAYFLVAILENVLIENQDYAEDIFLIFENLLPNLLTQMYEAEILKEKNIDILPPLFRFAFYIKRANDYKLQKQIFKYLEELKNAFKSYPLMKVPILNRISEINDKINQEKEREIELKKLAAGIKNKIYELITLKRDEEALSVICQLQSIVPDDMELKELKSRIISK